MAVVVGGLKLAVPSVQDQLAPLRAVVDGLRGGCFAVESLVDRLQVGELALTILVQRDRVELNVDLLLFGLVEISRVLDAAAVAVHSDLDGPLVGLVGTGPDEFAVRAGRLLAFRQVAAFVEPSEWILQTVAGAHQTSQLCLGFAAFVGLQVEERNPRGGGAAASSTSVSTGVEIHRIADAAAGAAIARRAARSTGSALVGSFVATVVAAGEGGDDECEREKQRGGLHGFCSFSVLVHSWRFSFSGSDYLNLKIDELVVNVLSPSHY